MAPEQRDLVLQQLEKAEGLAVPMLADYIWWKTDGKVEYADVRLKLEQTFKRKVEEKDEKWVKIKSDFESAVAEIKEKTG